MRHNKAFRKLNRTSSHRKAMFSNMLIALVKHEQIEVTLQKGKELKRLADKLITKGKHATITHRIQALKMMKDQSMVNKVFDVLAKRYDKRPGGYTRLVKKNYRYGDNAHMAILEFVQRDESAKGTDSGPTLVAKQERLKKEAEKAKN